MVVGQPALPAGAFGLGPLYILLPLVLTMLMVVFAAPALAPELKFLTLSVLGVPTCFLVGYGITRTPGVSRIL